MTLQPEIKNRATYVLFVLTLFLMTLTGFGQMPIYKRYYLSDIPGMNWLANFYATRYVHYLGAVVLIFFVTYFLISFILRRKRIKPTKTGYLRSVILLGIVLSGVLLVMKNYPGYLFSPNFIIFLNLFHLISVMLFLMLSLICLLLKKEWIMKERTAV